MTGDQTAELTFAIGALILVMSSLFARRLAFGHALRMILSWVAIFALVLVAYAYRAELGMVWQRVSGDLFGQQTQVMGGTLRVPVSPDGHFWVTADVNGTPARFLIDSGATTVSLSEDTAQAAGVEVDRSGFPVLINTANGRIEARRARIERLELGPIVARDMAAIVAPNFGETNVIGMNFLSSLESWRVEGDTLILDPPENESPSAS